MLRQKTLPQYEHDWALTGTVTHFFGKQSYDLFEQNDIYEAHYANFNEGQRKAFNTIQESFESDFFNCHWFIQKPGGTGKTYLYESIVSYY